MLTRDNIKDLCNFYKNDSSFQAYKAVINNQPQQQQWDLRQQFLAQEKKINQYLKAETEEQKISLMDNYFQKEEERKKIKKQIKQKIQMQNSQNYTTQESYILKKAFQKNQITNIQNRYKLQTVGIIFGSLITSIFWKKIPIFNKIKFSPMRRIFLIGSLIAGGLFLNASNLQNKASSLFEIQYEKIRPQFIKFVQNGDIRQLDSKIQLI